MHPEIARQLAQQRRADLARARRAAGRSRPWPWLAAAARLRWLRRAGQPRLSGAAGAGLPQPAAPAGVFGDGTEAYGFRIYLTPREARKLARDCSRLAGRYAGRLADPASRPPGAVPLEVVLLSRRLPEPAGTGRGLPGCG